MTDIGTVGFAADTKGLVELQSELDRAKEKADRLTESFNRLKASGQDSGPAFTQARQATAEYEAALGNLVAKQLEVKGSTTAMETLVKNTNMTWGQAAAAINQANAANAAYGAGAKGAAAAHTELNAAGKESSGIFSGLASMLGLTNNAMISHTGHATAMTAAHHGSAAAVHALREAMHILEPQLAALGIQMQGMTQFSYAARAGMVAFAGTVAGAVILEMAKTADVIEVTRNRLEGLAGAKVGTQLHEGLKSLAGDIGNVAYAMEPALGAITKLKQEIGSGDPHIIFLEGFKVDADQAKAALGALWEQLRMGGASEDAATAGVNKFFEAVKKSGSVTGDIFRELEQVAPAAATHIASALTNGFTNGIKTTTEFEKALDKVPLSLNGILTVLQRMSGATGEAFKSWKQDPKTVAEAVNMLKNSFDELWKSGSGGNDFNTSVRNVLKTIAGDLDSLKKAIDDFRTGVENDTWAGVLVKGLAAVGDGFKSLSEVVTGGVWPALKSIGEVVTEAVWPALKSIGEVIMGGVVPGLQAIGTFVMDAISKLGQLAQKALEVAQTVAGAIANMFKGGGGNPSGAGGNNPGSTDATGAVGGGTGGASDSGSSSGGSSSGGGTVTGGDAGTIDMGDLGGGTGGITDGFATGGGFTVGGDGGTDTTPVAFMATKGEMVDIYHGDKPATAQQQIAASTGGQQVGTGAGSPVVDLLSARFARDISEQTVAFEDAISDSANKIVGAVNALGVILSNANFASQATTTSSTTTTASGLPTTPKSTTTATTPTAADPFGLGAPLGAKGAGGFTTASGHGMGDEYEKERKAAEQQQKADQQKIDQQAQQAAQQAARQAASRPAPAKPSKPTPSDYGQSANQPALDRNGNPIPGSSTAPFKEALPGEPGSAYEGPAAPPPGMPGSPFEGPVAPSGLPMPGEPGSSFFGPTAPGAFPVGTDPMTAGGDLQKIANDHLSDANQTLDEIRTATDNFGNVTSSGADQTSGAVNTAASTISNSILESGTSVASQIAADLAQLGETISGGLADLGGSSGGSGGSGGGGKSRPSPKQQQPQDNYDYGNGGYSGGASVSGSDGRISGPFDSNQGPVPYSDYGTPWGPDTTGTGVNQDTTTGSSVGDVAGGYMSSGGSSYTGGAGFSDVGGSYPVGGDPVVDSGGGGYAEGGSFVVGGDGGQDTTRVSFMATKGETVTISNDNIPGSGDPGGGAGEDPVYAGAFAHGGTFTVPGSGSTDSTPIVMHATKGEIVSVETPDQRNAAMSGAKAPVNIIVSPGVQADDFIRSRAQMQRAMG